MAFNQMRDASGNWTINQKEKRRGTCFLPIYPRSRFTGESWDRYFCDSVSFSVGKNSGSWPFSRTRYSKSER